MKKHLFAGAFPASPSINNWPSANLCILGLTALFLMSNASCKMSPTTIKNGMQVSINYTLTVDGKVADSSAGREPLSYLAGSGQIIPGLDEALIGLKKGDKQQFTIPPEKGYGALNPKAIQKIPRKSFGHTKGLKVGMMVSGQQGGQPIQAKVVKIDPKEISLDMNHPLAGKTLVFDIEVVDIKKGAPAPTGKQG